jgi:phosphate uptake regulator
MKRKVIQVGNSTQLISLPRKWCKAYNIEKGQELTVEIIGTSLRVATENLTSVERKELDIKDLSPMILRSIVALYKKGVDEIRISYNDPSLVTEVQKSIGKEAVGFEIIDQSSDHCIIKHVSGELGDFDSVLRRTFLLLINMAKETLHALEKKELDSMKNIAFLEQANNRFTTICRRLLNKKGHRDYLTGPLYYIIEDLENIADEFKYLCQYLSECDKEKIKVRKEILSLFSEVTIIIDDFYSIYYKFDKKLLAKMGRKRKLIVKENLKYFTNKASNEELIILHHLSVITQKMFCLIGPYLVMKL